jgi:uncharacterized membrane protein
MTLVVGWSRDAGERTAAAVWDASGVRSVASLVPEAAGWAFSFAWDANDDGLIVGVGTLGAAGRGFLVSSTAGTVTELPTLGGGRSDAYAINHRGEIAGRAQNAAAARARFSGPIPLRSSISTTASSAPTAGCSTSPGVSATVAGWSAMHAGRTACSTASC